MTMTDNDQHHVAIVSFEGAIKREIKRVREALARDETLSAMRLIIKAEGSMTGDLKLEYSIAVSEYSPAVSGDNLNAVADEFMRRRGWSAVHEAKALIYHKIPGDDTDDAPAPDDDAIPF